MAVGRLGGHMTVGGGLMASTNSPLSLKQAPVVCSKAHSHAEASNHHDE